MLGFIGGVYGVLFRFGMVLVMFISERTFFASVLSKMYQSENTQRNIDNKSKNKGSNRSNEPKIRVGINEDYKSNKVVPVLTEEEKSPDKSSQFLKEETKSEVSKYYDDSSISKKI